MTACEAVRGRSRRKHHKEALQEGEALDAAVIALSAVERGVAEIVRGAVREELS